jgi:interleukin-1 receptor-associated kinase 1
MYVDYNGGIVRAEHIERLLCFEYMEGGILEKHISGTDSLRILLHACK